MNNYLLDRLPTEDAQQSKQSLIDTAMEILSIIIQFFGRGDLCGGLFVCSSRLSVYFGIPSAGVLLVELLKQHRYPRRYSLKLPRSRAIQDLSVFSHYLSAVEPCNGNYVVCSRKHKVIEKVLNQILEPASSAPDGDQEMQLPQDEAVDAPLPSPDMSSVLGPIDDMDFLEWVNAVDWTKGPWTENV